MQVISRCAHPAEILNGIRPEFELTRAFVRGKLPGCDHYLITTFFYPKLRRKRTDLVPPLLRPEILQAKPARGEHLLVYQTAEGHERLPEALARTGLPCRIYGMRRELEEDVPEGDLLYRPFDERRFIDDLASARAVILAKVPEYEGNLARYAQDGNRLAFEALDGLLDRAASGLL